jgi:hypothetical protein
MSTVVLPKGHRHTRSAAMPPAAASPHHPQNPYHLTLQANAQNAPSPMDYSTQPTTPPRTPRRETGQPHPQNKANSGAPETGSKQKPRNKKPKNIVTSPVPITRNGHNPPGAQPTSGPPSSKPITTPSTPAFAGPTFHASPAPSALPIPSFYSRSVPESPGIKGLKAFKEPSSSDSTTPPPAPVSNHREESPLDLFFRADREEKARARSASSAQSAVAVSAPFRPPSESPHTSQTPPASTGHSRLRQSSKMSPSGMFAMELEGSASPGVPYGPAFSTPYAERITAARASLAFSASKEGAQKTSSSEALKAYLFAGPQQSSPTPSSSSGLSSSRTSTASAEPRNTPPLFGGSRGNGTSPFSKVNNYPASQEFKTPSTHGPKTSGRPSSGLRQEVTPTKTPTKTPDRNANYATSTPSRIYARPSDANDFISTFTRSAVSPIPASPYGASPVNKPGDLKDMEDSLRKMLKLESAGSSGASGPGIGSVPAAAVSPNYVDGRGPLNGMHNGVVGS